MVSSNYRFITYNQIMQHHTSSYITSTITNYDWIQQKNNNGSECIKHDALMLGNVNVFQVVVF